MMANETSKSNPIVISGVQVTISFAPKNQVSVPPLVFEILKAAYIKKQLS